MSVPTNSMVVEGWEQERIQALLKAFVQDHQATEDPKLKDAIDIVDAWLRPEPSITQSTPLTINIEDDFRKDKNSTPAGIADLTPPNTPESSSSATPPPSNFSTLTEEYKEKLKGFNFSDDDINEIEKSGLTDDDIKQLEKQRRWEELLIYVAIIALVAILIATLPYALPAIIATAFFSIIIAYCCQSLDWTSAVGKFTAFLVALATALNVLGKTIMYSLGLAVSLVIASLVTNFILFSEDVPKILKNMRELFSNPREFLKNKAMVVRSFITTFMAIITGYVWAAGMNASWKIFASKIIVFLLVKFGVGVAIAAAIVGAPYITIPLMLICWLASSAFVKQGLEAGINFLVKLNEARKSSEKGAVLAFLFGIDLVKDDRKTIVRKIAWGIFKITLGAAIAYLSQFALAQYFSTQVSSFLFRMNQNLLTTVFWIAAISRIAIMAQKVPSVLTSVFEVKFREKFESFRQNTGKAVTNYFAFTVEAQRATINEYAIAKKEQFIEERSKQYQEILESKPNWATLSDSARNDLLKRVKEQAGKDWVNVDYKRHIYCKTKWDRMSWSDLNTYRCYLIATLVCIIKFILIPCALLNGVGNGYLADGTGRMSVRDDFDALSSAASSASANLRSALNNLDRNVDETTVPEKVEPSLTPLRTERSGNRGFFSRWIAFFRPADACRSGNDEIPSHQVLRVVSVI